MSFDQEFIDFGLMTKGEKRNMEFEFTNSGNIPFEIDIVTSCTCTETAWPIATTFKPGEKGLITATFDSTEKEEKSEVVDVDIILAQNDPKTKYPKIYTVQFKYELKDKGE